MSAAKWESNDSGHRAVLRAASEFTLDSFRSKKHVKGVSLILGKHSSDSSVLQVQSVVFDKEVFETSADAKRWWADNSSAVDKTYDSRAGTPLDSKGIAAAGITKHFTSVQLAADSGSNIAKAISIPTTEQLAKINMFTRTPKTADEVSVFPVLACNDIIDRDMDRFPPETVAGFAALQGPLSPIGKSFMVGHDTRGTNGYSGMPVGRVFDAAAVAEGNVNWLRTEVYIPNTDQNKSYLENVDFGIYWAVSVGVMLGGAMCSVGEPHEWGWHPYICSKGHEKGQRYDPTEEAAGLWELAQTDDSGVLCWRDLVDPQDFYELSQVYLGAQYMAEFDKNPARDSLIDKAASFGGIKVLSTPKDVVLPVAVAYPEGGKFAVAREAGLDIQLTEDGSSRYKDSDGLVWTFDPSSLEELCLGRVNDDAVLTSEEKEVSTEARLEILTENHAESVKRIARMMAVAKQAPDEGDETTNDLVAALDALIDQIMDALDAGDADTADALLIAADTVVDELMDTLGLIDPDEGTGSETVDEPTLDNIDLSMEVEEVPKAAVLSAVKLLKFPPAVEEAVTAGEEKDAVRIALSAAAEELTKAQGEIDKLATKAALGDSYVQSLRADALHWYTMSQRDPQQPEKGVDATRIERMLTLCGDDIDLIKSQIDLYRGLAREKFPEAVRRSTFPEDVNDRGEGLERHEGVERQVDTSGPKRIHG